MKHLVLAVLLAALARPALALNWKCGIDISFSGTEGTDYVVEQLFHDSLYDDRSVVYLKSTTQISFAHNERNINSIGQVHTNIDSGFIYYKIDGDELRTGYTWGRGGAGPDSNYSPPYHLYAGPFTLASVKGQLGDNGVPYNTDNDPKNYDDVTRMNYGMLDSQGAEWHVLTYWDDEKTGPEKDTEGMTNDGKILYIVLDPGTPAIRFSGATAAAQYYTTPPKNYYIPKIFDQITYVNDGVRIHLANITNGEDILYRVGTSGTWLTYGTPLQTEVLFTTDDTQYALQYKLGTGGDVRTRTIHYNPASPGAAETHPSRMCWASDTERQAIHAKLLDPSKDYLRVYNLYKNDNARNGLSTDYHNGIRRGKRSYGSMSSRAMANALICQMEGMDHLGYAHANKAKEQLLNLYAIDPIGFEHGLESSGYRRTPCLERVSYVGDNSSPGAALAYDMLATYTTTNGYADGFTPIEELKVRDNLASEASLRLKWLGIPYAYGTFWHALAEAPLVAFAAAMPTYDTHYYGTSGADGTPCTHAFTPFPDQQVSWWDYCNNEVDVALGHPNVGTKSIFHNLQYDSYGFGTWDADGFWFDDDRNGYQMIAEGAAIPMMALRKRYDGYRYERLESYIDINIRTRFPNSGSSIAGSMTDGTVKSNLRPLINNYFPQAGMYMWYLATPIDGTADINGSLFDLMYFDNSTVPVPPEQESKKYLNLISLGSNIDTTTGICFRMLNKYSSTDHSNLRPPYTTHFNLTAHGERLVVDGMTAYSDVYSRSSEARNAILVDDDETTWTSGISNSLMGRIGPAFFTGSFDYGRVATNTGLNPSDATTYAAKDVENTRHVFFPDKKYFILVDNMESGSGTHTYGWTLHGSSDGLTDAAHFAVDNTGNTVTWTKTSGVSLQARFMAPSVDIAGGPADSLMAKSYMTSQKNEPYIIASATGENVRFATVLLPLASGQAAPTVTDITVSTGTAFSLADAGGTVLFHTQGGTGTVSVDGRYRSDAEISLVKASASNALEYCTVINGTSLQYDGTDYLVLNKRMNAHLEYDAANADSVMVIRLKPDTDDTPEPVTATLGGLVPGRTYHAIINGYELAAFTADASGKYALATVAKNETWGNAEQVLVISESAGTSETTAPEPPTGLNAQPGDGKIYLAWTASVSAAEYDFKDYTLYTSSTSGSGYTVLDSNLTKLTYTVTGVSNGEMRYFVLTARDIFGNVSSWSGEAAMAAVNDTIAPAAPRRATAVPGNGTVFLAWERSTDDSLRDFAGYSVYRSTVSGSGYTRLTAAPVLDASYRDTTAVNGTLYYYMVTCLDAEGNESGSSPEAAALPSAAAYAFPCHDDFDDGNYDQADAGLENGLSWTVVYGSFGIENNDSSNALQSARGASGPSLLVCGQGSLWTNYDLSFNVFTMYASSYEGGYVIQYRDTSNYYYLDFCQGRLVRRLNGGEEVLATGGFISIPSGRTEKDFRVTVNSDFDGIRIRVDANNDGGYDFEYLDTDSAAIAGLMYGTIGFYSNILGTSHRYLIDDIVVAANNEPVVSGVELPAGHGILSTTPVTVAPHPVTGPARFSFLPGLNVTRFGIFTPYGQMVHSAAVRPGQREVTWEDAGSPAGLYLYLLETDQGMVTGAFVKK